MYFSCTFKNRPRSESVKYYAEHKIKNVIKQFSDRPVGVQVSFEPEGEREVVHLNLHSGRAFSTNIRASGTGFFEAVDRATAKLKNLLRKKKERAKDDVHRMSRMEHFRRAAMNLIDGDDKGLDVPDAIDAAEILKTEHLKRARKLGHALMLQ